MEVWLANSVFCELENAKGSLDRLGKINYDRFIHFILSGFKLHLDETFGDQVSRFEQMIGNVSYSKNDIDEMVRLHVKCGGMLFNESTVSPRIRENDCAIIERSISDKRLLKIKSMDDLSRWFGFNLSSEISKGSYLDLIDRFPECSEMLIHNSFLFSNADGLDQLKEFILWCYNLQPGAPLNISISTLNEYVNGNSVKTISSSLINKFLDNFKSIVNLKVEVFLIQKSVLRRIKSRFPVMDRFILATYSKTNIGHPGQDSKTFSNQDFIPLRDNPPKELLILQSEIQGFKQILNAQCVNKNGLELRYSSQ
jgi:hypothetical protein